MSIERIDPEKCVGCGTCVNSCPLDVIRMDEKGEKAVIAYAEDCMNCFACELDCPAEAVHVSKDKFEAMIVGW